MERLSDRERQRLVELLAEGAPAWRMHQEIHRSRWAIRRAINALQRPPKRGPRRSPLRLSLVEREEISRGVAAGESLRAIASRLGRAPSTVSREVAANGGPRRYRAARADAVALRRMRRPKSSKLAVHDELRALVESKLELKWSPEQIAGWLGEEFPDDPEMRVSHKTIYLSERPAEANDRAVPGHWEGDLIFGKGMSAVATLVERKSRFVMLIQLPNGHTADVVADALAAKIVELPEQLRRSITWDQGKEMAHHARFSVATGVPVFFCDPRSPWQRGSNENTNGLLRQYFPKRSDLKIHTQADLDAVADELNGRPRQTHHWKSPSEALDEAVAMTA